MNYDVLGLAVRKAVSRKRKQPAEALFDEDWAKEIEEYREAKKTK